MKRLLAAMAFAVAASIACSATRSASSPRVEKATTNQSNQSSPAQASSTGQQKEPCALNMTQVPAIKGLKLSMTTDEVLALFPGSKDDPDVQRHLIRKPDAFGDSELVIHPPKYQPKDQSVVIKQISFGLLHGKVYSFNIGFNGPAYKHVDEFLAALASETNLPPVEQWEPYVGLDHQLKILKCADFEVRVFAGGQAGNLNYVIVRDLFAEKDINDRREKAEAQASPTPGNQ